MVDGTKSGSGVAKKLEPFVCGGSAATFASCVIHPIDLAKVNFTVVKSMDVIFS